MDFQLPPECVLLESDRQRARSQASSPVAPKPQSNAEEAWRRNKERDARELQLKSVEIKSLKKMVLGKSQLLSNPHIRNAYQLYTQS